MKNTRLCPKCQSSDIIRIRGKEEAYGAGNYVRTGFIATAGVHRYVCLTCGFTEEWIDREDLDRIRKKYKDEKK